MGFQRFWNTRDLTALNNSGQTDLPAIWAASMAVCMSPEPKPRSNK